MCSIPSSSQDPQPLKLLIQTGCLLLLFGFIFVSHIGNSASAEISDTVNPSTSQDYFRVPINLESEALSSTSIRLAWDAIDTAVNDAIIIRYSVGTIRMGRFTPPTGGYDSVSCLVSDTAAVITGLIPDTRYCFVLQTTRGSLRSLIAVDSREFCTTFPAGNQSVPPNSIVIDTIYFDSIAGSFRVSWCIDPADLDQENLQVAFTYGFTNYPDAPEDHHLINQNTSCIDTSIQLYPMLFDTLYYCALWLRSDGGSWREPTVDSRDTVRIPEPFRQVLPSLYSIPAYDTLTVFNGSILLWKKENPTETTGSDTVEVFMPDTTPEGMIIVGRPFFYRSAHRLLPVTIGIRIDSLPAGKTLDNVLIYTYFAGIPSVCYGTETDSERRMVHVETENIDRPFIAMIDTVPPRVEILSDTGSLVFCGGEMKDSIRIHDNIANVRWAYHYGSGDRIPPLRQENGSYRTGNQIQLSVSQTVSAICSEAGLRASLIVTDGNNYGTIDMSRSVRREQSDAFITEENVWVPVYATAVLDYTSGDSLLDRLPCVDSIGYDKRFVRLYRWMNYEGNSAHGDKWVEYNPGKDRLRAFFTLDPGRLFWLKTRGNIPVHLGSSHTLSLRDTFGIELPPQQWTDFGMPYRFAVRLEEILSASGGGSEQIQFYRWTRDSISRRYMLEPLYVPGMSDHIDRSATLGYLPKGGYSLYNNSTQPVLLRIPPVAPTMAKPLTKAVARTDRSLWSGKFVACSNEGVRLPVVYFGYSPNVRQGAFPVAPSFALFRLSVFDRKTGRHSGHVIDNTTQEGLIKELVIRNVSDSVQTIRYHFERTGNFPEHYSISCFDAAQMWFDSIGALTIPPKSRLSRWVVVGDADYTRSFINAIKPMRFFLDALYPNPARYFVNIRYHVPFGTQERIRISIFSLSGKRIRTWRNDDPLSAGSHTTVWNGKDCSGKTVAAGIYIVRLTVISPRNGNIRQFNQQVTWMR